MRPGTSIGIHAHTALHVVCACVGVDGVWVSVKSIGVIACLARVVCVCRLWWEIGAHETESRGPAAACTKP
jgi:hypothetical protein